MKTWTLRKTTKLRLSASQDKALEDCYRKWWFQSVRKLPRVEKTEFLFGSILHSVLDRYLRSDDPNVDLYPDGWHISYNRFNNKAVGSISSDEQLLVKDLVAEGIKNGTVRREPGREVEAEFVIDIVKKLVPTFEDPNISMTGFVDLATPGTEGGVIGEITDHKTVKRRKYAKGARALEKDPQMLTYAEALFQLQGIEDPAAEISLRHNTFVKDPDDPAVFSSSVLVKREDAERHWKGVVSRAKKAAEIRLVKDPFEIEAPNKKGACDRYGGCPFAGICGGTETIEDYIYKVQAINSKKKEPEGGVSVGLKEKLAARLAASEAKTPASKAAPTPPEWYVKGCRVCGDTPGYLKGEPCKACVTITQHRQPTTPPPIGSPCPKCSSTIKLTDPAPETCGNCKALVTWEGLEKGWVLVAPPKPKPAPVPETRKAQVIKKKDVPAPPPPPAPTVATKFTMLLGCGVVKSSADVVTLSDVSAQLLKEPLAFSEIDARLAEPENVTQAALLLSGKVLVVPFASEGYRRFLEALIPFAGLVVKA